MVHGISDYDDPFVCVCMRVRESAVADAVASGCLDIQRVRGRTGASSNCGDCAEDIAEIVDDHLARTRGESMVGRHEPSAVPHLTDSPRPSKVDVDGCEHVAGVVLAAGQGRRLAPITNRIAKPLVPILNVPLLFWVAWNLRQAGVQTIVCNVHSHAEQFDMAADVLRERDHVQLTLIKEKRLSGPAGGLAVCRSVLPYADSYVVVSGDAVTDLDLAQVIRAHRDTEADLTVVATSVADPWRFGVLQLNDDEILGIDEKPDDPPTDAVISCGIYVMSPRALVSLNPTTHAAYDFKHVVPSLVANKLRVRAFRTERFWADVGTAEALRTANLWALSSGRAAIVARQQASVEANVWLQGAPILKSTLRFGGSVLIGDAAHLEQGAEVCDSVIGPGARIGSGARVRNSVVMADVDVPARATVENEVRI